jgi:hypothetical protein
MWRNRGTPYPAVMSSVRNQNRGGLVGEPPASRAWRAPWRQQVLGVHAERAAFQLSPLRSGFPFPWKPGK